MMGANVKGNRFAPDNKGGKMMNAIEFNIRGIKCDACDYNDTSVEVENYADWVNKPCPECGENLLTEQDYNTVQMMISITKAINQHHPSPEEGNEIITLSAEMNGTGNVDFKLKD